MRILHVIANLAPRYGGPPKACFEMARAVARRGHEVAIYATNQDGNGALPVPLFDAIHRDGVEIRFFPIGRPRFWGTSLPLAKALRVRIPWADVVHVHSLYLFHDFVASSLCAAAGRPYLIRPHGTLDPYIYSHHTGRKRVMEFLFQRRAFQRAAAIHFTAQDEWDLARPHIYGRPGIVIPLGLDFGEYENLPARGTFRARHPETGDRKLLLFFGRLHQKKGLDILATTFAELARQRDDVHLVVAGPDDGMEVRLRRWLADSGVLHKTTFTGMLHDTDKLAAMRDATLFLLPSFSENFGIAVIEAMACGLPVVISDKVNLWREVEKGECGKVLPCDPRAFTDTVKQLLADPEGMARMGANGRMVVRDRFNWDVIAGMLEETYMEIAESGEAARLAAAAPPHAGD